MIRILIADDHPLARRGLVDIFENESDVSAKGEAQNGLEMCSSSAIMGHTEEYSSGLLGGGV